MIAAVLRWLILLVADLTVFALAWLLAPILPAFAIGRGHLPRWLSWPLGGKAQFACGIKPFGRFVR